MKLLFPNWTSVDNVNLDDFDNFCLQPAIYRRGIIKEQCHNIDDEFKIQMPHFWVKTPDASTDNPKVGNGAEENQLF